MNIYQFFIIAGLKLIAIQIMLAGIIFQIKEKAKLSIIIITIGSLVFAVAGNTLLFMVLSSQNTQQKELKHVSKTNVNTGSKSVSSDNRKYFRRFARLTNRTFRQP